LTFGYSPGILAAMNITKITKNGREIYRVYLGLDKDS